MDNRAVSTRKADPPEDGTPHRPDVRRTERRTARTGASTLSTAHIRPFVQYSDGGSFLKACRGGDCDQVGGGKRGAIHGFSYSSRRRLMMTISKVRRDAELPIFVTMTYPDEFPDPDVSKVHLSQFIKRFRRRFPAAGLIWKLEPQQRGAPHYHLLVWGPDFVDLAAWVPFVWFDIAGGGDRKHLYWHLGQCGNGNKLCVSRVNSFKGVFWYAAKYLGKTFEVAGWNRKWTGRYWGVIAPENIPFGELKEIVVTRRLAVEVMRYQRRFKKPLPGSKKKRFRSNGRSLTIFCDADQWVERLCPLAE